MRMRISATWNGNGRWISSPAEGQRCKAILNIGVYLARRFATKIPTGELNRLLATATERVMPAMSRGRRPKLFYATQAAVAPPTFVFFTTDPASIHFSYRRYLENRLREAYGFDGTPIRLIFREQVREKRERKRRAKSR